MFFGRGKAYLSFLHETGWEAPRHRRIDRLRHLFGCELPVGHLMIDRAGDVIIKAYLENLSRYIASRDFGQVLSLCG